MKPEIQKRLHKTLNMSTSDRASIAERLLSSLDDQKFERDVENAWQIEIQQRLREIDELNIECISWEDVKNKLKK